MLILKNWKCIWKMALTLLASSEFFLARMVYLSSGTDITQPFNISLSYLYSTCELQTNQFIIWIFFHYYWNCGGKLSGTNITLLEAVLSSMDKIRSVHSPDPFVLGGLILLLVVKLRGGKAQIMRCIMRRWLAIQFHGCSVQINADSHCWCSCRLPWRHECRERQVPCWCEPCFFHTLPCISAVKKTEVWN